MRKTRPERTSSICKGGTSVKKDRTCDDVKGGFDGIGEFRSPARLLVDQRSHFLARGKRGQTSWFTYIENDNGKLIFLTDLHCD